MTLRDELLAEVGPNTHIAKLCGRASDELLIRQMKIDQQVRQIERLRQCLHDTREEICKGPVDDTLWHTGMPACTTVDNICMALKDDWDYDAWLELNAHSEETQGE